MRSRASRVRWGERVYDVCGGGVDGEGERERGGAGVDSYAL